MLFRILIAVSLLLAVWASPMLAAEREKIVIAHRGACGYLPEHTREAKALAYGMGADFLEQDVVLTRDNQPVVLHDLYLDAVTDVAQRFPGRQREDGRFYVIDFELAELRTLRVSERIDLATRAAMYPGRFPAGKSHFQIVTLAEELEMIQGLNKSSGRDVGIYPEIKGPQWHRRQGKDISLVVLQTLQRYGYREPSDRAYLQCFDREELQRIRGELGCQLKLVQLVGARDWARGSSISAEIRRIAQYADGIGPHLSLVIEATGPGGKTRISELVRLAHQHQLAVHPYTLRADVLPEYADAFDDLLRLLLLEADVDGVFTDFPDLAAIFLRRR